ncbi:MAG TPA: hypothetical protein VJP79_09360 [Nitrososphaera sp.]|nr:hypothetical protein [Nitrososphaera sp.]
MAILTVPEMASVNRTRACLFFQARSNVDVFRIFFLNIKRCYRWIYGGDGGITRVRETDAYTGKVPKFQLSIKLIPTTGFVGNGALTKTVKMFSYPAFFAKVAGLCCHGTASALDRTRKERRRRTAAATITR